MILVAAPNATQALWAMEEALRSAVPAAVAGVIGKLDFRASQRLHIAAAETGRLLFLLHPPGMASVAVTRWRVAAAGGNRNAHEAAGPGAQGLGRK